MKFSKLSVKNCILCVVGSVILSFGLYNVHSFSGVTEGGVLGFTLLIKNLFNITPAISSFIMNALCYAFGIITLGKSFIAYSLIAGGSFSLSYYIFEHFEPIYPQIGDYPLAASLIGAVFVGVGVGLAVRGGGAPTGDDALAMGLEKRLRLKIQWIYLISDLTVLALSLMYIPIGKIAYSLITVVVSGQIIGFVKDFHLKGKKTSG